MEALHIIKENPTKNVEDVVISQSKFEIAYDELRRYLEQLKQTKGNVEFNAHESVITRMIYSLGQAALSEVLSIYDTSSEIIGVGDQTYRRKHRAPKEYQTALVL